MGVEGYDLGPLVHLGDDAGRVLHVGLAAGEERLRAQPPPAAAAGGPADTPVAQARRRKTLFSDQKSHPKAHDDMHTYVRVDLKRLWVYS